MMATGYNPWTALLETIQTGNSDGGTGVIPTIQSDRYDYDPVGNLLHRYWLPSTGAAQMSETFICDELDRLKSSQVGGLDLKSYGYDALGNLTSKTNVGGYAYPAAGSARPHLVSGITGTVAGLTNPGFAYDANGNLQNGLNRGYTWSAANLPFSVDQLTNGTSASATLRHEFLYGPDRQRTREIVRAMSGTTLGAVQRTIYSADSIEKEIDTVAGTTKIRTYLPLGLGFTEEDFAGTAIAPTAIGTPADRYYHKDNLGSPDIVTDASQTVLERMAYDAWGRRRQSNGLEVDWQSLSAQSASNTLDHKGYTGQEQLDDLSLVHLNGRVYDPMTGRFTSPDPTIPDPYDLQSLNRASYVRNSPMDRVDPTGFSDELQTKVFTKKSESFEITGSARIHHADAQVGYLDSSGTLHIQLIAKTPVSSTSEKTGSVPTAPTSSSVNLRDRLQTRIDSVVDHLNMTGHNTLSPVIGYGLTVANGLVPNDGADWAMVLLPVSKFRAIGRLRELGTAAEEGTQFAKTAEERANELHAILDPRAQRARTTAVTETEEGIRVVSSSERRLSPAQRRALGPNEVEGVGAGHAEVTGTNAAKSMNLTPTGTAASRPICMGCAVHLEGIGVDPLSPLK